MPPATVAEWTLNASDGLDWYDVSLVDGFDLPMRITNNVGCPVADCPVDLGKYFSIRCRVYNNSIQSHRLLLARDCPAPLKRPLTGTAVGCLSACAANLDGNQQNSANCCSGSHDKPATCPPTGVAFYSYFKARCPNSYVYAYDVSHHTSSRNHRLTTVWISGVLWNCSLDMRSVESRQLRADFLPIENDIEDHVECGCVLIS